MTLKMAPASYNRKVLMSCGLCKAVVTVHLRVQILFHTSVLIWQQRPGMPLFCARKKERKKPE